MTLLLVAARLAPVTFLSPAFGGARVPWWIRLGLALLLAALLAPLVAAGPVARPELLIPRELAVGFVLALLAAVPFWAAQAAGAMSDAVTGLSGRLAELLLLLAAVVFFASDGHLLLVRALATSYQAVPLTASVPLGNAGETVIAATAHLILAAVGIAAPVLVAVVVADVAFALVARAGRGVALVEAAVALRSYAAAFALLASLASIALAIRGELGYALAKLAHPFG